MAAISVIKCSIGFETKQLDLSSVASNFFTRAQQETGLPGLALQNAFYISLNQGTNQSRQV